MPTEAIDVEKLAVTLKMLAHFLQAVSKATPTSIDDRVVAFLNPMLTDPDFAKFLAGVIDSFQGQPVSFKAVQQHVAS